MKDYELDAAMQWLFHHGTALIVMSNIIGKFGLRQGSFGINLPLEENETIFYPEKIKTIRPKLTYIQIRNSLKSLEIKGFIKIAKIGNFSCRLNVLINPFDFEIAKRIAKSDGYGTGYSWFE